MTSKRIRPPTITLLGDGQLDTLTLGQADPWLLLADDEAVDLSAVAVNEKMIRRKLTRCPRGSQIRCRLRP
jgi:hypothetical protein